jgi:hypothetical protein
MKSASIFVAIAATLLVMSGCAGTNSENNTTENSAASSTVVNTVELAHKEDSLPKRQFIRTSEMKFRVKMFQTQRTRLNTL